MKRLAVETPLEIPGNAVGNAAENAAGNAERLKMPGNAVGKPPLELPLELQTPLGNTVGNAWKMPGKCDPPRPSRWPPARGRRQNGMIPLSPRPFRLQDGALRPQDGINSSSSPCLCLCRAGVFRTLAAFKHKKNAYGSLRVTLGKP